MRKERNDALQESESFDAAFPKNVESVRVVNKSIFVPCFTVNVHFCIKKVPVFGSDKTGGKRLVPSGTNMIKGPPSKFSALNSKIMR